MTNLIEAISVSLLVAVVVVSCIERLNDPRPVGHYVAARSQPEGEPVQHRWVELAEPARNYNADFAPGENCSIGPKGVLVDGVYRVAGRRAGAQCPDGAVIR